MSSKLGFGTRFSPAFTCSSVYKRVVPSTPLLPVVLIDNVDNVEVMTLWEAIVVLYSPSSGLKLSSRYMKEAETNNRVITTNSL
jgi:hypothetical protein